MKDKSNITQAYFFSSLRKSLFSIEAFENGYFNSKDFSKNYSPELSLDDDGDGLFNYWEVLLGTRKGLFDTDGDGWSDSAELIMGSLPNMSLEYPSNIIIDGTFGDWLSLHPSLIKFDDKNDDKGCMGEIDIESYGAAILDNSLLLGARSKQLKAFDNLLWEVQIESSDIGNSVLLRSGSENYYWDLFSEDGEQILKQELSYRMKSTDFEAWVPLGLLENVNSAKIDYLSLRIVVYRFDNGNYEMCDDTQWLNISK